MKTMCCMYLTMSFSLSHLDGLVDGYSCGGQYSIPEGLGDNLIVEVQDSKGHNYGRVLVQVAALADNLVNHFCTFESLISKAANNTWESKF